MSIKKYFAAAALALTTTFALSPGFNNEASAQSSLLTETRLSWDAMSGICGYVVYAKEAPGFIGEPGTMGPFFVAPNMTSGTFPRGHNTVYEIRAFGWPPCGETQYLFSGPSNRVANDDLLLYYRLQANMIDADGDGLPKALEDILGSSDQNRNSSGYPWINDMGVYTLGKMLCNGCEVIIFENPALIPTYAPPPQP